MRGLFINEIGACSCAPFKFKRDPAIIAAAITGAAAIGSSLMNTSASSNLNEANRAWQTGMWERQKEYNTRQAYLTRQHQLGMLQNQQDWEEYMYGQYNSPSALRRQYQEAGYNPYLVGNTNNLQGQNVPSVSAPSGAQASAPAVGTPQTFMADYSGIGRAGQAMLEGVSVKANVANQSAQTVNQAIQNYIEMAKLNVPKEERDLYLRNQLSLAYGSSFDADRFITSLDLDNKEKSIRVEFNQLALDIEKEFGRTERADKIMNMEQQFSVMAAEIGRMAVQNKLDEASIDRVASEIARNFAAAGLDNANAELINKSMQFLVNSAQYEAYGEYYKAMTEEGEYSRRKPIYDAVKTNAGQTAEQVDYYMDKVVDKVGKVTKINIGLNRQKSSTYFESQNKNWNVRSNFDYKHGITAP